MSQSRSQQKILGAAMLKNVNSSHILYNLAFEAQPFLSHNVISLCNS